MAEYREIIKQFKRMCDQYKKENNAECPLSFGKRCSSLMSCEFFAFNNDEEFQDKVLRWAENHPAPVYPTWGEWLIKQGVISGLAPGRAFDANGGLKQRIPEDIAQKLGIEPKEG